jgi:hypothetical protein
VEDLAQARDEARDVGVRAGREHGEIRPGEKRLALVLGEPALVGAVEIPDGTLNRHSGGHATDLPEPGHVPVAQKPGGIPDAADQLPAAPDDVIEKTRPAGGPDAPLRRQPAVGAVAGDRQRRLAQTGVRGSLVAASGSRDRFFISASLVAARPASSSQMTRPVTTASSVISRTYPVRSGP